MGQSPLPTKTGGAANSGLPIAILSYEVVNTSSEALDVSVCGSIRNFVGKDGSKFVTDWKGDYIPIGANHNINLYKEDHMLKGIYMYSDSVPKDDPAWGTTALTTNSRLGHFFWHERLGKIVAGLLGRFQR